MYLYGIHSQIQLQVLSYDQQKWLLTSTYIRNQDVILSVKEFQFDDKTMVYIMLSSQWEFLYW